MLRQTSQSLHQILLSDVLKDLFVMIYINKILKKEYIKTLRFWKNTIKPVSILG
jgi:hypothetical protein